MPILDYKISDELKPARGRSRSSRRQDWLSCNGKVDHSWTQDGSPPDLYTIANLMTMRMIYHVFNRCGTFHSGQDLKSTALQVCLRALDRGGQPLHRPPLLFLLLLLPLSLLLLLLHHDLGHTLVPASSLLNEHHVKVPEVARVLLGLHPLDKLRVEAEVVPDAVLPTVIRGREEWEIGAGKTRSLDDLNDSKRQKIYILYFLWDCFCF